jgi:AAA domain
MNGSITTNDDRLYDGVDDAAANAPRPYRGANFGLVTAREISALVIPPPTYDIAPFLDAENGPAFLTGPPSTYKTWFALECARAIATGTDAFGAFAARKRPFALHINLEMPERSLQRRVQKIASAHAPENLAIANWTYWDDAEFEALLERHPGAFVTIDCFAAAYAPDKYERDEVAMRRFMSFLMRAYEKHGCNGFVVDHVPRRPGSKNPADLYFGSVQKKAAIRQGITLVRSDARAVVEVHSLKPGEHEEWRPFAIEFDFDDSSVGFRVSAAEPPGAADVANAATLLAVLSPTDGQSCAQLQAATGKGKTAVVEALNRLTDAGHVRRIGGGRSTRYVSVENDDDLGFMQE